MLSAIPLHYLLCFMIALEKPFRYALRLYLMVDFLVRHAIFEIT